jgi:RNA polymerase sigma-70 factor (ECF subfamily)
MYPVSGHASSLRSTIVSAPERSVISLPQLAARAQLGDREALEALLSRLAPPLRLHIEQLIGDADRAEDVLQDVLFRVARKLPTLREHAWVRAWAYRIATRDALRQIARGRRFAFTSLNAVVDLPATEVENDSVFDSHLLAQLPSAVAALPEASRVVVRLHYLHGFTQPEVAEILSIPLGTVKSRLAYGLRVLRARIAPSGRREPT